jgi:hypothetical protein
MRMSSWRVVLLLALSLAGAACSRSSSPPAADDPAFEARWKKMAGGGELVVVGNAAAEALAANVRRASQPKVEPALEGATATAPAGTLPEAPAGDEVGRIIRSNLSAVKGCYASVARQGTGRSGKAIVTFGIGSDGRPTNVQVDAPSFKGTALPTCLSSQVSFWAFPRSKKGAESVSYPFLFVGG